MIENKIYENLSGKEIILNQLSEKLGKNITEKEFDEALVYLTEKIIQNMNFTQRKREEEEKDINRSRLNDLLLLKIFCYKYSLNTSSRPKTKKEVLSEYSASTNIVDKATNTILNYLIEIITDARNNTKTR